MRLTDATVGDRLPGLAEAVILAAIVAAPWDYGCAPDAGRYLLCAVLLVAAGAEALGSGVRVDRLLAPALALPALGLLQLATGSTVAPVWTCEALLVLLAMLSVMLFVARRATDPSVATRLAVGALIAGLAQAGFGAYAWSVAPTRLYGIARPDITMPFGSFVNHNHFAGFVELAALLAFGMAAGTARKARRLTPAAVALGGVGLALAAGLLASRSRGGLVALAAGAVFCAALTAVYWRSGEERLANRRRLFFSVSIALLAFGFALAAVSPSARAHLATLWTAGGDSSGSYRIDTARATLRLFAERPLLGGGLGAYEDAVARHKRAQGDVRTTHAESDALEWLAESGLLGVMALAWLAWVVSRRFAERLQEGRDPFRKGIAIGAASGVFAVCVHSLFDFNLRIPSNALLLVVLLGLAAARPGYPDTSPGGAPRPRFASTALFLLAIVAAWRAVGARELERSLAVSYANTRIEKLDALLRLHPYIAEAWRARGLAWRELGTSPSPMRQRRLERASEDLGKALALRPLWGEAWVDRGWVNAMQGDLAAAESDLAEGSRLDPTHPGIRLVRDEFRRRVQLSMPR